MRTPIQDQFTRLPISRQRKYQLRQAAAHHRTVCGGALPPGIKSSRCLKHLVSARELQRLKRGLKRRYTGTLSYRLQAAARAR